MHAGTIDENDMLLARLKAIADDFPELAQTARLFGTILPLLRDGDRCDVPFCVTRDAAREKLGDGHPLLHGMEVQLDIASVMELMVRLASAAESAGAQVEAEALRLWFEDHYGEAEAVLQDFLNGNDNPLTETSKRLGMNEALIRLFVQSAMKPLLRSWGRQLAPLAADVKWEKGTCFVCGAAPLFAELQGNSQEKHLRCGLCGADWRVKRLSCFHCGNEDHRSLRVFLPGNDPDGPRIEACDRCGTYVKVIPAFSPTPVYLLPVEDLATLRLNALARKSGYRSAATT